MNYLIIAVVIFFAACAKAQEMPANPIPAIPKSLGQSVVEQINLERFKLGLKEIQYSDQLTCAASLQANYLARSGLCTHDGGTQLPPFWKRAEMCGGKARGEVVACGQADFFQAVKAWMNSPGHRAIIMDPSATQIGGASLGRKWVVLVNK